MPKENKIRVLGVCVFSLWVSVSVSLSSFNFVCVCAHELQRPEQLGSQQLKIRAAMSWLMWLLEVELCSPGRAVHTLYAGPLQPHASSMCSLIQILSLWLLDLIWASKIPRISSPLLERSNWYSIFIFHLFVWLLIAKWGGLEVKGQPKVSILMRHPLVFCDLSH